MDTLLIAKEAIADSLSAVALNLTTPSQATSIDWGLIISIITLLFGAILFWKYDKRIKSQEKKLNDYQLRKNEQEEADSKKAEIRANVIKGDKGKRTIKVFNRGMSDAYNLNLKMLLADGEGVLISNDEDIFPYKKLTSGDSTSFYIHISSDTPDILDVKITWKDDFKEYNEYTQTLTLQ